MAPRKNTMKEQHNKPVALITGGSTGLGFALATELLSEGYEVILIARNKEKLNHAINQLHTISSSVIGFAADISQEHSLQSVTDYLAQNKVKLHFLILNAGIIHVGLLKDTASSTLREIINNNLFGTMLSAKLFSPFIDTTCPSKILFITSAFGLIGAAGYTSYCAAKAGIINFAAALRRELPPTVSVQVACPTDIDTSQFTEEQNMKPSWMKHASVRTIPMPASTMAIKILKQCKSKTFIIHTQFHIYLLLSFIPRLLPQRLVIWIQDRLLPRPPI
jgi:3-dehydrosphinganine reductase